MKKLLFLMLLISGSALCQNYTINAGDSYSIGVRIDSSYTITNLQDLRLDLGRFGTFRLSDSTLAETSDDYIFQAKLSSEFTQKMRYSSQLTATVIDSIFGVKKITAGYLKISRTSGGYSSSSTNDGFDLILTLTINDSIVTSDVQLLALVKGEDGTGASADSISLDNSELMVASGASNLQDFAEKTDAALLRARSTGVQFFDGMAANGASVDFGAGKGSILHNYSYENTTYEEVNWSAQTIVNPSQLITYWYVDSTGAILNQTTRPTPTELKDEIYLGFSTYESGAVVAAISEPTVLQQLAGQLRDFMDHVGDIHEGGRISAATGLEINRSAMETEEYGRNFVTNPKDPHDLSLASETPLTFQYATRNGGSGVDVTDLDFANWDNNGTIEAITGSPNTATIQIHVVFSVTGASRIIYGQTLYNSVVDAEEAIANYTPATTAVYDNAIKTTYIIASRTASSSGDAVYINTNKFGLIGGGIASAGSGYLEATNNLSDLNDAATARGNLGLSGISPDTDGLEIIGSGDGLIVTSPDGLIRAKIGVDNSGAITVVILP